MPQEPQASGKALLSVFDRIYIISLPTRPDRRAEVAQQLARLGLSLSHPQVTMFDAVRPDGPGEFESIGARGCFFSHLGVLEEALDAGDERFLILEDDADFSADFPDRIAEMANQLRARSWGMVYGWNPDTYGARPEAGNTDLIALAPDKGAKLSHFIGFDRATAARALPYLSAIASRPYGDPLGGAMHVDGAYCWFRRDHPDLTVLAPRYSLAVQRPSRSDIHDAKWFDRIAIARPLVAVARRVKGALRQHLGR